MISDFLYGNIPYFSYSKVEIQMLNERGTIDMNEYLTAADIAKIIHCGKNKAYWLMHQPDFPSVKIGGRYLVSKDEFDKFMKQNVYKEYPFY